MKCGSEDMKLRQRAQIFVSGFVQGVSFRFETKIQAQKLGLFGWAKNLEDGRVEVLVEGEKEKIEELISWMKKGPSWARVESLEVKWQEYQGEFRDFQIF